jgi:hypothetical protein
MKSPIMFIYMYVQLETVVCFNYIFDMIVTQI